MLFKIIKISVWYFQAFAAMKIVFDVERNDTELKQK